MGIMLGVGVNVAVAVDIGVNVDLVDSACFSISGALVVVSVSSCCVNSAKIPVRIIPIKDPPGCIVLQE